MRLPKHLKSQGNNRLIERVDNSRTQQLARLVAIKKHLGIAKPRRRIPRQVRPVAIEREYTKELLGIVTAVRRAYQPIIDTLPQRLAQVQAARRLDAGDDQFNRARQVIQLSDDFSTRVVEKYGDRTARYQKDQLNRQVKAGLGVDVFIGDKRLSSRLQGFVSENVSLIKDLPDRLASNVEQTITRALQDGSVASVLAEELDRQFEFGEDRARRIARDQIGKLYGQINADRQQELGITKFVWRTVNDSRVRSEHEDRNGQVYSYDDPPDGELPGEPINCRCSAEPVFDDILN